MRTLGPIRRVVLGIAAITLAAATAAAAAEFRVQAELVSAVRDVQAGTPFWVAIRQRIDPGWHTYWRNPGDTGEPTRLEWALPSGATAEDIVWPPPARIRTGPAMSYGYTGEVLLPVRIVPPSALRPGDAFPLRVTAAWLVCEVECIPEEATLTVSLPVAAGPPAADPRWGPAIERVLAAAPRPAPWLVSVTATAETVTVRVAAAGLPADRILDAWFYPLAWGLVDFAADQALTVSTDALVLRTTRGPLPEAAQRPAEGVLVITERLDAGPATQAFAVRADPPAAADWAMDTGSWLALLRGLALALVGGLVLNAMPCVLPVLSLKVLALTQPGGSRSEMRAHGFSYTAGILLAFGVLAGGLLVLRAGGERVGWGFQLQSSVFVALLAYLLFGMGLALSGAFVPGVRLGGVGEALASRAGYSGSFFTGALAAVVATPCTAPFMAAALGYALTQPAGTALLIFEALGLGLALPYLAVAMVPAWARLLPRPGAWMERLKQFLAFPLYGSAAWLLWVLSQQTGPAGLAAALAGLVLLALGLWLYEATRAATTAWRGIGCAGAGVCLILAVALVLVTPVHTRSTEGSRGPGLSWEPYTADRLAELRARGVPVLMNVTAAWCITCLVNERVALQSPQVAAKLAEKRVASVKADWTNRDPAISQVLESFQRSGVPLYVLFPGATAGGSGNAPPRVLPQILTEGMVLEALERL